MGPSKFSDPAFTLDGTPRATVPFAHLDTLWFNTGTRCNLSCENCYIESHPKNDRLSFLLPEDITPYLDEIRSEAWPTQEIGFTGGEPFLNPHMTELIKMTLSRGFKTLVLTNAYRLERVKPQLKQLADTYGTQFTLRVSLDHYEAPLHEAERGPNTFLPTINNLKWLVDHGIHTTVAGRSMKNESQPQAVQGYQELFDRFHIPLQASEPATLVIFPEMDPLKEVPEISVNCWGILNKEPSAMMCSNSRMVVKRKGESQCKVLSCTLLAYDPQFEMGTQLKHSVSSVPLNHKFCAQFCVLGGASCS
jgi:organic radical activating enzyme